jgi:hypothetical protein
MTTLIAVGMILFLAYLWRRGGLGAFLDAVTGPGQAPPAPTLGGISFPAPPRTGGGIGNILQRAEEARRRRENPNDPILSDTPLPGSPGTRPGGTWNPGIKRLYPNLSMLLGLEALRN